MRKSRGINNLCFFTFHFIKLNLDPGESLLLSKEEPLTNSLIPYLKQLIQLPCQVEQLCLYV